MRYFSARERASRFIAAVLMLLVPLSAHAATAKAIEANADRIIEPEMKAKHIPGLVLAVIKDGKVVVKKGYGVSDITTNRPPDAETVFSIGSLSKALTAVGVMRLVQEKKLSLDDVASKYISGMPPQWQSITIRQFMTHTSGIPQLDRKLPTFEEMLKAAANRPMKFEPGTDQDYNNFNYAVMGKVIETISGQPYLEYMRAAVFEPAGMRHTGRSGSVETNDRAIGYAWRNGKLVENEPEGKNDYGVPSGFLETTLDDLIALNTAINDRSFLHKKTYEEMITPTVIPSKPKQSFTPGWEVHKAGGKTVVAKNGAVEGFASQFHFIANGNDAVIFVWNNKGPGLDLWNVAAKLVSECLGVGKK